MLRIPAARVDAKSVRAYFRGDAARARIAGKHLILDLHGQGEEPEYDEASHGSLAALTPIRTELMRGDLRVAYLAWLLAVQSGAVSKRETAPPTPPGLAKLTAAQTAIVELLRIDEDLIAAAVDGSDQAFDERNALRKWALALPPRTKDDWLLRAIDDPDLALGSELLRTFRGAAKPVSAARQRTVANLVAAADRYRDQRARADVRRANRAKKTADTARKKHLDALGKRRDAAWTKLEALVENRAYDDAITLATDLRDLANRDSDSVAFTVQLKAMRKRLQTRRGFFERWNRQNERQRTKHGFAAEHMNVDDELRFQRSKGTVRHALSAMSRSNRSFPPTHAASHCWVESASGLNASSQGWPSSCGFGSNRVTGPRRSSQSTQRYIAQPRLQTGKSLAGHSQCGSLGSGVRYSA